MPLHPDHPRAGAQAQVVSRFSVRAWVLNDELSFFISFDTYPCFSLSDSILFFFVSSQRTIKKKKKPEKFIPKKNMSLPKSIGKYDLGEVLGKGGSAPLCTPATGTIPTRAFALKIERTKDKHGKLNRHPQLYYSTGSTGT